MALFKKIQSPIWCLYVSPVTIMFNGGLKIFGFKMTSDGVILDWADVNKANSLEEKNELDEENTSKTVIESI